MFGRRRHRAPVIVAPPAAEPTPVVHLSEEQLFEKVRARLDRQIGAQGDWTLVRRSDGDTDTFFHEMAAFSLAREITSAIVGTATRSESGHTAAITPVITVQTVPSGTSGLADIDSAVAAPGNTTDARPVLEHVMFELDTVAVWADPERHDPAHVDMEMVTPSRARRRWYGTRAS